MMVERGIHKIEARGIDPSQIGCVFRHNCTRKIQQIRDKAEYFNRFRIVLIFPLGVVLDMLCLQGRDVEADNR